MRFIMLMLLLVGNQEKGARKPNGEDRTFRSSDQRQDIFVSFFRSLKEVTSATLVH